MNSINSIKCSCIILLKGIQKEKIYIYIRVYYIAKIVMDGHFSTHNVFRTKIYHKNQAGFCLCVH